MLKGKTVVLGITGSIAAYKIASLASMLKKQHCNVHVIMTHNAMEFITPLTFERLTGNKCITETFDKNIQYDIKHIALAKQSDLFMIAPASANIIGKIANGIADDMLSTTVMAAKCPVYISPAMNTAMYENKIVQDNIKKLSSYGYNIIDPACGMLACGDIGAGKMPEPDTLLQYILKELSFTKDLSGKKVLITTGATCESIDPVRYITNHSTGKMGYALAKMAMLRGADVTVISGHTDVSPPMFVNNIPVVSAKDMFESVKDNFSNHDIIIKAAAVADYTPITVSKNKIKKSDGDLSIPLSRTQDILAYLGQNRTPNQFICGFSMETENMLPNSKSKLERKNIDMIVANNLTTKGAGFGTDTNVVTLITKNSTEELPLMSKENVANAILDTILRYTH